MLVDWQQKHMSMPMIRPPPVAVENKGDGYIAGVWATAKQQAARRSMRCDCGWTPHVWPWRGRLEDNRRDLVDVRSALDQLQRTLQREVTARETETQGRVAAEERVKWLERRTAG
jgi:hypothetical protein